MNSKSPKDIRLQCVAKNCVARTPTGAKPTSQPFSLCILARPQADDPKQQRLGSAILLHSRLAQCLTDSTELASEMGHD